MSAIRPFNRTQGGIIGLFTRFLPPQPANQEKLDMDWDDVKDYATLSTYVFEFREGSESWTPSQRRRAASLFGLAHLGNLWYPMASIVALGVGGWLFTKYYLRQYSHRYDSEYATFRTAAVHAIYNRIAIYCVGVIIAIALWR